MAIKQLDNVQIDGLNQAFGGYIYAVEYDANYGEQPSTLRVTVTNESGQFTISPGSLYTIGSPVQINIGTKIVLYMYPMEYVIEESPKGKFLQIDYVDESIVYLDKQIVKLKSRGVSGESYPNTIVVGFESIINSALTTSIATLMTSTNQLAYADPLRVADVVYSLPQLLSILQSQNIIGQTVKLDTAASNYYQSYCGRLREVLSAWCNDLALGFYWENRQLNFVDLNNPANLSAVISLATNARSVNNVAVASTRYSIKDSFTRAIDGQLNKDGALLPDLPPTDTILTMNYLDFGKMTSTALYNKLRLGLDDLNTFESRVKAAYYGKEAFLLYIISISPNGISSGGGTNSGDYLKTVYYTKQLNVSPGGSDQSLINRVLTGSKYQSAVQNYNWYSVTCNLSGDFEDIYKKYKAYADAWGKYFYIKMAGQDAADKLGGALQTGFKTYTADTLLQNVDILSPLVAPLSSEIPNYETITLLQFIENNPQAISGQTLVGQTALDDPPVYVITELNPPWNPKDSFTDPNGNKQTNNGNGNTIGYFGNTILVEGSSTDFTATYSDGKSYPIFYFGSNISYQIITNNASTLFSNIITPPTAPLNIKIKNSQNIKITNYAGKIEFEDYIPPATANVNYYDLVQLNITEEQVLGASYYYYGPNSQYTNLVTKTVFDQVFNTIAPLSSVNQPGPFFSATYTIPNIDMAIPTLSIGQGFMGFNISITDNGIRTSYVLGTEKMRIRNPDIFIRYYYDNALNKYRTIYLPSIMINKNALN